MYKEFIYQWGMFMSKIDYVSNKKVRQMSFRMAGLDCCKKSIDNICRSGYNKITLKCEIFKTKQKSAKKSGVT